MKTKPFGDFILLSFLAYAPWHGAQTLGSITPTGLALGPLSSISIPGMFNFGWIALLMCFVVVPFLVREYRKKPPTWPERLILLLPLISLLNLRVVDSLSIVSIENWFLVSGLMLMWLRHAEVKRAYPLFFKHALLTMVISYFLALVLPALIPIEGRSIWRYYFPVMRYIGWHGEGAPYSTIGMCLIIYGSCLLLKTDPKLTKKELSIVLIAIFLGLQGIRLNVQRTSMIGATLSAAFLTLQAWRLRKHFLTRAFLTIFIFCSLSLLTGKMAKKAAHVTHGNSFWYGEISHFSIKDATLDHFIATSGRLETAKQLLGDLTGEGTPAVQTQTQEIKPRQPLVLYHVPTEALQWIGRGTGSAPRNIRKLMPPNLEPNCDYVRILVEHGWIGFTVFLVAFGSLLFSLRSLGSLAAGLSIAAVMIGENLLVLPTYVSGPMILVGILVSFPVLHEPKSVSSS